MTALGEFLERFYDRDEFFRTVRARVLHTIVTSLESSSTGGRPIIGRRHRDDKARGESTKDLAFWAHIPNKVRVETTCEKEGRSGLIVEVVNGDTSWRRYADRTVENGRGQGKRAREICSLRVDLHARQAKC